jgi:hypothetical protein
MTDPENPAQAPLQSTATNASEATRSTSRTGDELSPDLEKVETAHDRAFLDPSVSRARSLARSQTSVTDFHGCYSLDDGEEVDGAAGEDLTAKRTATDAYEVRWDGADDPLSPRNMSLARKWLIVVILSSCSFLVCVQPMLLALGIRLPRH